MNLLIVLDLSEVFSDIDPYSLLCHLLGVRYWCHCLAVMGSMSASELKLGLDNLEMLIVSVSINQRIGV